MQRLGGVGHRALGQFITIYNGDGSGQVDFLLHAKAHNDHFAQCLGIFEQLDLNIAAFHFYGLCLISDIRHFQLGAFFCFDSEISIQVRDSTHVASLNFYCGSDNRFAVHFHDFTSNLALCHCHR